MLKLHGTVYLLVGLVKPTLNQFLTSFRHQHRVQVNVDTMLRGQKNLDVIQTKNGSWVNTPTVTFCKFKTF